MGTLRSYIFFKCVTVRYFSNNINQPIMKYLNVAEKNDAAKNIASLLSRGNSNRREGLSQFNKIYEFDATVFGTPARMVMTSVSGHLLNYEFVAAFRNWASCNPVSLFDAPIMKTCPTNYQKIKLTLEREIRSCQGLIIWTDCDREGENIGFEIIKVCTDIKPNIPVYRAKFSEITSASVYRALNNLGQPNKNVSDAVDVRQELDLRTGAAFTRLQTLRLCKVFPQKLSDRLISYGSCQFPTLGFVVERYKEIEEFVSEPFWRIKMSHTMKELTVDFNWKRDRLFDKEACEAILDICQENPLARVEEVESKNKSKWRPLPLDTVELEKTVSRKLRINAKDTMKVAEKLYTQGYISYPRTETNIFPKELNLVPLVEQQFNDNRWGDFAQRIIHDGGPIPRQGRKSDQAHPPIHPTKYVNNLSGNEHKIYEYIVRHFLACVSKDAVGHETVVHVDVADEKFVAKGLFILEKNYLEVYIYDRWNAKEIHEYQVGDTFTPTELNLAEGSTTAPKLLTEADLIALMEKHGIGTDATHAEHIETIKNREYVGLHENIYFVPGTLGMGLVEGYNNIALEVSLAKPNLRADFEKDLKLISDGHKRPETVQREQIEKYKQVFITVLENMIQINNSLANRLEEQPRQIANEDNPPDFQSALKCPKCSNDMFLRKRKNGSGFFLSCVGFPLCNNAIWFPPEIETATVLDETCPECGPSVKKLKIKFKQNLFPGDPNPNVLCIGGCDESVLEVFNIRLSSVRRTNTHPQTVTSNNATVSSTANNSTLNNWVTRTNPNISNNPNIQSNTTNFTNNIPSTSSQQTYNASNPNRRVVRTFLNNIVPSTSTNTMPVGAMNNSNNTNNINRGNSSNSRDDNEENVMCYCNKVAIQLTVRKEGPNTGRLFYKCADSANPCNLFQWKNDTITNVNRNTNTNQNRNTNANANQNRNTNANQNRNTNTNTNSNSNSNNGIKCNCDLGAVERMVTKEGPNKGRRFYCCSKPIGEGCRFFKWADESSSNNGRNGDGGDDNHGGGGGGGHNQSWSAGNTSRWTGGSRNNYKRKNYKANKKKYLTTSRSGLVSMTVIRKCGICKEAGHNRTNCPNK